MAISLTCTCGARLEIDDTFAGRVIPCPDCQRALQISEAAVVPPPPQRPAHGLALASLITGLVGAFTIVGSLAAIVLGLIASQQITRAPERLGGLRLARAGIGAGVAGLLLTLCALLGGDWLGVDALLREYRSAAEVDYHPNRDNFYTGTIGGDEYIGIERPTRTWGRLNPRRQVDKDMLTLANLREDAYLMCLHFKGVDNLGEARDKALERLQQSGLFKSLSRPSDAAHATGPQPEAKPAPLGKEGDQLVELRLGGCARTFLLRVVKQGPDYYLLAGGARSQRFARLVDEFLRSFESFKLMPVEN